MGVVKLKDVSLSYTAGKAVLNQVNFTIRPGEFYFLTGRSGAGKSSLLSLLSLARKPTGGVLEVFGENITYLPRERLPYLKRRIGMVYQDYRLLENLTVKENVSLPLKVAGEDQRQIDDKAREILDWIGLYEYTDAMPAVLSGGQKQRVAIARAVINKPDLILADEPTGNLDPALSLKFMHLFETLHKDGATIVIATHDEALISRFAHHAVLRLQDGKLARLQQAAPQPSPAAEVVKMALGDLT